MSFIICLVIITGICAAVSDQFLTNWLEAVLTFIIVAVVINFWLAFTDKDYQPTNQNSRAKRQNSHYFSISITGLRRRAHHFHFKRILGSYRQTQPEYIRNATHQFEQLNQLVQKHSHLKNLLALVRAIRNIKSTIDEINLKFKLPFQLNYPTGIRSFMSQFKQIWRHYLAAQQDQLHRLQAVKKVGKTFKTNQLTVSDLNLYFNYQRLTGDRFSSQIDLLVINPEGIFALTLLDPRTGQTTIDQNGNAVTRTGSKHHWYRTTKVNVAKKMKKNYRALNYVLPATFTNQIHTRLVCISPQKINSADSHLKVYRPDNLFSPKHRYLLLDRKQIKTVYRRVIKCQIPAEKTARPLFRSNYRDTFSKVLTYVQRLRKLDNKLKE